jgi:hypothetical protein
MIPIFVSNNVDFGLLQTILQENVFLNVLKLKEFTLILFFEFALTPVLEVISAAKSIKPVFQSVKLIIGEILQQLYAQHFAQLRYIHMDKT